MRIIDLLNKIAKGEEVPKKIRINHWCYKFEWVEHLENYYDKDSDIDLMSALSMSKEELNYEVKIIEEDKKIEYVPTYVLCDSDFEEKGTYSKKATEIIDKAFEKYSKAINELIEEIEKLEGKSE